MSTISTTARNSNLTAAIAVAVTIIVAFTFLAVPSIVAPQPALIPVTGSQDVNSATQSYIAWAEAAEAEASTVDSAIRSYTAWAEAAEAEASTVDSATRSYVAQAKAVACNVEATYGLNLDSATRSYIAWGLAGALCR